jgi:hypothetical protein
MPGQNPLVKEIYLSRVLCRHVISWCLYSYLVNGVNESPQYFVLNLTTLSLGIFAEFSLYIINFAGRISEAALGRGGGGARSALFVKEPKKTGPLSARACTRGKNPLVKECN